MGVFSTMGDIMSTVAGNLEYRGGIGDIMIKVGDILSTVEVFSTVGDIMMHMEDIMGTVVGVQYYWGILSFEI